MRKLGFEDESFRTAPQSLWATRMRTETMLGIAPQVDDAGFEKVCVTSAAAFETAVMYLYEDPWERLRLLRRAMPKTPLNFFIRSRNLMGWRMLPNDVIELFLRCIQRVGIEWVEVFDGLNDLSIIEWHFRVAKKLGLQRTGHISYTDSPVHTDEYFTAKARELIRLGVDVVNLSDPCGAMVPERARSLFIAVRQALKGKAKLGFFAHDCTGVADDCYVEAMRQGVDILKTVSLPLAHGYSLPATTEMVDHARRIGVRVKVDEQRSKEIDDYFFWAAHTEKKPIGKKVQFNPVEYKKYVVHQIPGGMMSNLENQLSELKLLHKLPEVLEEAGRVRQELGYPVMVTPYSQLVGVQAVFNVVEGERYRTVPQELRLYVRGAYGKPPGPLDPDAVDRILAGEDKKPIDPSENFSEPLVSRVRSEQGPFESDEDLLLAIFNTRETMDKFHQNKKTIESHPVVETPLAFLVRELATRHEIRTVHIQKGSLKSAQISKTDPGPDGRCALEKSSKYPGENGAKQKKDDRQVKPPARKCFMGPISREDVLQILKILNESRIDEFHLETGGLKLIVKKEGDSRPAHEIRFVREEPMASPAIEKYPAVEKAKSPETSITGSPREDPQRPAPIFQVQDENFLAIRAPMLGVFYRAPKPDAHPFVEVGQFVHNDDVVCIIEVMKLFNTVRAGVQGRIAKICVENAQLVEYNQILFFVEKEDEKAREGCSS